LSQPSLKEGERVSHKGKESGFIIYKGSTRVPAGGPDLPLLFAQKKSPQRKKRKKCQTLHTKKKDCSCRARETVNGSAQCEGGREGGELLEGREAPSRGWRFEKRAESGGLLAKKVLGKKPLCLGKKNGVTRRGRCPSFRLPTEKKGLTSARRQQSVLPAKRGLLQERLCGLVQPDNCGEGRRHPVLLQGGTRGAVVHTHKEKKSSR